MGNVIDLVVKAANTFYETMSNDENGRFHSWEHCYKCFHDARTGSFHDDDYLSLQLAFYLASWGMYRGSSFLLQKDYKVHIPVVKELLKSDYDCLSGIDCEEFKRNKDAQNALNELNKFLNKHYESVRNTVKGTAASNKVSDTLITKVLMGTLGCVPAYDRYFIEGIKIMKVSTRNYNLASLIKLVEFYEENHVRLEEIRKNFKVYGLPYPQMKLLDMAFWQIGLECGEKS